MEMSQLAIHHVLYPYYILVRLSGRSRVFEKYLLKTQRKEGGLQESHLPHLRNVHTPITLHWAADLNIYF